MEKTFKAPQGVLRALILVLSSKSPVTGTDVINEVKRATSAGWVPSPGSIYYLIGQLKKAGLLMITPGSNEKRYIATSKGEEEIQRIRQSFKSGLMKNAIILHTLAAIIDPREASRLSMVKRILEMPEEEVQQLSERISMT